MTKRHAIKDLSRTTGIPYHTLYGRWQQGDRGERLTRPSDNSKRRKAVREATPLPSGVNTDLVAMKHEQLTRRQQQEQEAARAETAKRERQRRAEDLRRQYLAAIRRPLIDASLLTNAERDAIYGRVRTAQPWTDVAGQPDSA